YAAFRHNDLMSEVPTQDNSNTAANVAPNGTSNVPPDVAAPRQDVQHGLDGVLAFESQIAEPDKDGSALRYRGVDLDDLVGRVPFEKVWGRLVDGPCQPGLT